MKLRNDARVSLPGPCGWVGGLAALAVLVLPVSGQVRLVAENGKGGGKGTHGKAAEDKREAGPPLAVAPFDAAVAAERRAAWAKHLGAPEQLENAIGMKLALVPPGEFLMGSAETETGRQPKGEDQHKVRLTKPYYLAVCEVTQDEYSLMMGDNPSYRAARLARTKQNYDVDTSRFPVERVSYFEALEFCRRLSELPEEKAAGRVYRLATEAEWEYAARAGTQTPFPFGATCDGQEANVNGDWPYGVEKRGPSRNRPATVGSFPANAFGIFDTVGNKWEWCADWIALYPKQDLTVDPKGPEKGEARVIRGGSWRNPPVDCRSAMRHAYDPRIKAYDVSFRIAMDVPAKPGAQVAKQEEPIKLVEKLPAPPAGVPAQWVSPSTGMQFVRIEPMGLWVAKYEATNGEFRKMVENHNSGVYEGISLDGDRMPVVNVNFQQARDFAIWMTEKDRAAGTLPDGYAYRLPFEYEWVDFARCGSDNEFPWGRRWPPTVGNFHGQEGIGRSDKIERFKDEFVGPCEVEKSGANAWGLYGVGGNVWEGCSWQNDYREAGAWRGGSWDTGSIGMCRVMFRSVGSPGYKFPNYGFRLVLAPLSEPTPEAEDAPADGAEKPAGTPDEKGGAKDEEKPDAGPAKPAAEPAK